MQNKDLNLLKLLVILNEERQTILAAKRMNLSQPTISIMLKKLRDQFDDPLFIRDKNNLTPTIKCENILATLPALLTQLDKLYSDDEFYGFLYHLNVMEMPEQPNFPKDPDFIGRPRNMLHSFATESYDKTVQSRWGKLANSVSKIKVLLALSE